MSLAILQPPEGPKILQILPASSGRIVCILALVGCSGVLVVPSGLVPFVWIPLLYPILRNRFHLYFLRVRSQPPAIVDAGYESLLLAWLSANSVMLSVDPVQPFVFE